MARDSAYFLNEISAAKKREDDFRKEGDRIRAIYAGDKKEQTPFNILFSNTETLLPALYSTVPRPVVSRRFKDDDPIGKAAASAGERCLEFLIDTNVEGYETYDEAMRAATLDGLLPGRGVTTIKYDSEEGELAAEEGKEATPYKKSELVCPETRSWNKVFFGYAKKWSKVPWIAYEMDIDREEAVRLFGAETAGKLTYSDEREEENKEEKDKGEKKTACIYQIWDKDGGKKIRYVSANLKDEFLKKEEDDPLGLTGFFNCPRPLQFIEKTNDLLPVAPYVLYEVQAKELNNLTRRIKHIVSAIKAKAIYDGELGEDVKKLVEADDNELVPADKGASLASEGGMQNAIWFWPVDKLITVLRELYAAREACKATIFEIMGLADIMRGASAASETLGAQEIKQAWGGLRLKRTQKEVARYARDLLRMMLEIAASKFSEDTWAKMTGLPYLTEAKFAELVQVMQAAQMSGQQEQLQQVQQQLQTPKWSDVLEVLQNDLQRSYRIDIETNSTVEPEAVEDQKHIAEIMTAIGQALNGIGPLVAQGIMPFQVAQSMLLMIVRRYRFGSELEEFVKAMQAPKPQDDGKAQAEQVKAQNEQQKLQGEMQMKREEHEMRKKEMALELQVKQAELEIAREKARIEMQKLQLDAKASEQEHNLKMEDMQGKAHVARVTAESKIKAAQADSEAKQVQASAAKQTAQSGADGMTSIMKMQQQLLEAISAEEIYDRDPKTQRISGKRKVMKKAA